MAKRYRATRNPDGSWNIHDVEIFVEMAKGERGLKEPINRAWMESAIRTARMMEAEAFKYRCHIAHHRSGDTTRPAGYIRLTEVKPITYRGETKDALFADIVSIPPNVFSDILDSKLPYRSVEIMNDTGAPQVDTLALLSTAPPHFRLAVLDKDTIEVDESAPVPEPIAAFAALKSAQAIGAGEPMKKLILAVDKDGNLIGTSESGVVFRAAAGDEPRQKEFIIKTPEGDYVAEFAAIEPDDSEVVALRTENEALNLKLKAHEAGSLAFTAGSTAATTGTTASLDTAVVESPSAEAVKLQARVDALEADKAEREAADNAKNRATDALSSLKGDGWHVPARCEESIVRLAAASDESLLDAYVEEFKATRPKDPVRLRGVVGDADPKVPDAVLKFNADGPDAFERALRFSSQFDELEAAGMARGITRESFIESQMNPLAVRS